MMIRLGMFEPVENVIDIIMRPKLCCIGIWFIWINIGRRFEPARGSPFEAIELDVWIARLSLLHQPPFVATVIILVSRCSLGTGFCPFSGIGITANLYFEYLQIGSIARFEEIIENLLLLSLWIVDEQTR